MRGSWAGLLARAAAAAAGAWLLVLGPTAAAQSGLLDTSGNGNNLAQHGGAWVTVQGTCGGTGFDAWNGGQPGYLEAPSSPSLNVAVPALTLDAWVYLWQYPDGGSDVGIVVNKESQYELGVGTGQSWWYAPQGALMFAAAQGSPGAWSWVASPGGVVPLGRWAHVTAEWDGRTVTFWVDGRQVGQAAYGQGQPIPATSNPVRVGARGGTGPAGSFFPGVLRWVTVYAGALPQPDTCPPPGTPVVSPVQVLYRQQVSVPAGGIQTPASGALDGRHALVLHLTGVTTQPDWTSYSIIAIQDTNRQGSYGPYAVGYGTSWPWWWAEETFVGSPAYRGVAYGAGAGSVTPSVTISLVPQPWGGFNAYYAFANVPDAQAARGQGMTPMPFPNFYAGDAWRLLLQNTYPNNGQPLTAQVQLDAVPVP